MRTIFTVFFALLLSSASAAPIDEKVAPKVNIDSALLSLDLAIKHSSDFVAEKQETINRLRVRLSSATDDRSRFRISHDLFDEYLPFRNDSALFYIGQCVELAEKLGSNALKGECQAMQAFQYSNTGMYDEALFILLQIDEPSLDRAGHAAYYRAYNHVYSEMAFYTHIEDLRQQYRQQAKQYEELLLANADSNSPWALQRREMTYMDEGKSDLSLKANDEWLKQVKPGTQGYALTTFYRYLEFKNRGDSLQMYYWLTESAVSDVRNAIMDQGSMWELANLLMTRGDIDRAYHYISFAANCATRFGTRLRSWQLSPILTTIDTKYMQYQTLDKKRTFVFLCVLVLLLLILAVALYDVWQHHKKLRAAHTQVHEQNAQLSSVNSQLSSLNSQLSTINSQLSAANSVKEEYVGHFMRLCSMYIDKLDNFRKRVNKMLKNHDYDDIYQLTRSQEFRDKELEDLYASFDSAFLNLFPDFVNDFNALLKPEERIVPEEKDRLNTSIRIFALIRLGIDDSSKIAEFLHYSVNTIYNYRARIKNGALGDREQFEQRVREIGMPT